ncbi:DUF7409 domain-containing protein [Salinirubrum litoreum]|uniref:Helix-hairpin-helix domain-containing protein n=1 Tax=Salinirubrum litoreum TaxID=1126234 RepID=A0ABD5R9L6_9EURY|nr:hypothetical protein [Salinirubrum litoreum]
MTDTAETDHETAADGRSVTEPTDLKFVGPATAEVVTAAAFDATDVAAKRVSYSMLVEAGVNPGVAAKIRRCHSLSWSFDSGGGLDRRSEQVRGLQDDERAWVAASSGDWAESADEAGGTGDGTEEAGAGRDEDWTPGDGPATGSAGDDEATTGDWTPGDWGDAGASVDETETSGDATADGSGDAVAAESAWRERSVPTPVTVIDGLVSDDAEQLADAGVTSVRSLATCTPELVADLLGFEQSRVETWQERATDRLD